MQTAKQHLFQILTKRSARLLELSMGLPWPDNVWMGVTFECRACLSRIEDLRQTGAAGKFLSCEPLLGPLDGLDLNGIDWVIVGGESGPGARPMSPAWARQIRDRCVESGTPFFFKQWRGANKKKAGRLLDGRTWDEYPGQHAAGHE